MFLLDTNVISELRRHKKKANKDVINWSKSIPEDATFLSVITIFEIEHGILTIDRKDPPQGHILRSWMNEVVLPLYKDRILPVDIAIAQHCAHLHIPNPRAERDALIAATAIIHNMTIVTRNTADFKPMTSKILNPWDE